MTTKRDEVMDAETKYYAEQCRRAAARLRLTRKPELADDMLETAALIERLAGRAVIAESAGPPGEWKCDACGFICSRRTINVADGTIGVPRIQEVPECSNGCGSLRRLTWEEDCKRGDDTIRFLTLLCERYEARLSTDDIDAARREARAALDAAKGGKVQRG